MPRTKEKTNTTSDDDEKTNQADKVELSKSQDGDKDNKAPVGNYWRILSTGTRRDHLVLSAALIAALASGVALPLSNIIFGRLIGNFTEYFVPGTSVTEQEFKHSISKNALFFVYLFIAKFVLTYISAVSTGSVLRPPLLTIAVLLSDDRPSNICQPTTQLLESPAGSADQQA